MTQPIPMTAKERIFQAVLFEAGAVLVSVLIIKLFGSHNTTSAVGISMVMAVMALVWNVVFNYGFDKFFTGERLSRGVGVRVLHVVLFEGGLLLFTLPLIAWTLNVSLWQALMMDISLSLAVSVYAFFYHWLYDYGRYLVFKKS